MAWYLLSIGLTPAYDSKESNIWRGLKHLFEAWDMDSLGRRNIDALSSSVLSTTCLFSCRILVSLSVSMYGTISVDLQVLIL